MNETAKEILVALLQNPAIMQPVPSAINPKIAQIQIVIDVVGTSLAIAEDFNKRINEKNEQPNTSKILT